MRSLSLALISALAAGAAPSVARAQDASALVTAVQLTDEAGELYDAGKYAEALDRYRRAESLVVRHSIGVRIARCLAHLGRLAEASERYRAVMLAPLPDDLDGVKLAKQKEAITQAEAEREALLPRIPGVVVSLMGPAEAEVSIDGQRFPPALFGLKRALDPGAHRIEARFGTFVVVRNVSLKEGQVEAVRFDAPPPPPPRMHPLRVAGIVVGAVGGTLFIAGAAAGISALAQKADVIRDCGADFACPDAFQDTRAAYNTARAWATLGILPGAIVAAAGTVMILAAPRTKSGGPKVSLVPLPGGAGLQGAF